MKIVIDTAGYDVFEGLTDQITLPTGKYFYSGRDSWYSLELRKSGLAVKTVKYYGACGNSDLNERAHGGFPVQVDGVSVKDFLDRIATPEECNQFLELFDPL